MKAIDLSNQAGAIAALRRAASLLKPPAPLLPSQWAEQKCRIPTGNAIPGPIRFRNAPYQVEPLNMMVEAGVNRISLMWGAQTGKSQVQLMAMGYYIDHDPQSIMHMQPSNGDLQTWLNAKFEPMVDSTPSLKSKIAVARGREGVNNQQMKSYPGGFLMFAWSGSPKTMRGRSAPKIFPDEVDGYERTLEGHPIGLIWQRAATFGDERLLFETSTPTLASTSYIARAFDYGDGRRWYINCPHCEHSQYLKWPQVQWQKAGNKHLPDTAAYVCEGCASLLDDAERFDAIRKGQWIAEREFDGHVSYHLPELASLFRKLSDIVKSFLEKKAVGDIQTFVNVSLAETWEEEGDKVDDKPLYARREHYPIEVPEPVLVLTCGVDTQDDRLEAQVCGWGEGFESWQITHEIFWGDPGRAELWQRLDQFLLKSFKHASGKNLRIAATCIDSGGHYTNNVYQFCKPRQSRRVYAIKGSSKPASPILAGHSKNNKAGVTLFSLGVNTIKELLFGRLKIQKLGAGYCHFPIQYEEEWFLQLTAEKRIIKYEKGRPKYLYIQTRPRNEALDCYVYNIAAIEILNPEFSSIAHKVNSKRPQEVEQTEDKSVNNDIKRWVIRRTPKPSRGFVNDW